jgi:hypothetical protein
MTVSKIDDRQYGTSTKGFVESVEQQSLCRSTDAVASKQEEDTIRGEAIECNFATVALCTQEMH